MGRCNKSLWGLNVCFQYLGIPSLIASILAELKQSTLNLQDLVKLILWAFIIILFAASTFVGPNALEQDSWNSFARRTCVILSWSVGRCNKSLWDLKECWYFSYQYLSKAQSVLCHCKRLQIKFIIWTSDSTPVLFAASTFVGPNALEQDSWKSFARRTCVILDVWAGAWEDAIRVYGMWKNAFHILVLLFSTSQQSSISLVSL